MAFQVPQWGFDFPINSSDLVISSTQCHYAVHNGPLNEQKTQMTSTGPRTEPQKPNSITSYSQLICNFENFSVGNQHFFRFSTKKNRKRDFPWKFQRNLNKRFLKFLNICIWIQVHVMDTKLNTFKLSFLNQYLF